MRIQVTLFVKEEKSFQAPRTWFPLFLVWTVTTHKIHRMTVYEEVVYMSPHQYRYTKGQAYVALSQVTCEELHIINQNMTKCTMR